MKKILFCIAALAGMLVCGNVKAQDAAAAQEPEAHEVYCEIIASNAGIFTNKMSVEVDFGQFASFFSNDRQLVDEQGRTIVFNSLLDAANYMAERGWIFKQAYTITSFSKGDSGSPVHHWIMAKTITDPSEITEGLRTARMMK